MKKLLYTFLVSLFGGFLALFMHNFYYDHSNNIITEEKDNMVNISFNPLSNSNLSVENDFVSAAEKTIYSVVHVKNTSISRGNSSLWDYFITTIYDTLDKQTFYKNTSWDHWLSIKELFFSRCCDITCASPFGKAVNIKSTSFKKDLLNLTILGNFLFLSD